MEDTVILVNPFAGRQRIGRRVEEISGLFRQRGKTVTVTETRDLSEAGALVEQTLSGQPEMLVCCGGDGTLSGVVGHLLAMGGNTPLGYIPSGTTNDLARFLRLPRKPLDAARKILDGQPKPLDVGQFGDRNFIYVASFGAFTRCSYQPSQAVKKRLGHGAYLLEGGKELFRLRSFCGTIETEEGERFSGEFLFGGMCNSTSLGGFVRLDYALADPADGLFELILVRRQKNPAELLRTAASLRGKRPFTNSVILCHTRGARFCFEEPLSWSLDGEEAEGGREVEVRVLPQAVRLVY